MPIQFAHIRLTKYGITRFWANTQRGDAGDCWPWIGVLNKSGYGLAYMGGSDCTASRVSWLLATGEQPLGYVCHTCDNPACVNPSHLYVGNQRENMRDMVERGRNWQARVTHCPRGHEYTPENTKRDKYKKRHCRQCGRDACKKWYYERGRAARGIV